MSLNKKLLLILLLAIAVRIVVVLILGPTDPSGGDFPLFDRMAKNLLAQGNFGGEPALTYGSPNINPGFALWLAFLYFIFGTSPAVVVGAQIVLGAFLVWGSYLLGAQVFNKRAGIIAALVAAFFPPLIIITAEWSSTLLYATLFLFSLYFFWRGLGSRKLFNALLAGALLGLGALTEAIAFYLPIVFALWLVGLVLSKRLELRRAALLFLVFFGAFALVLSPWALRNVKVANHKEEVRILAKGELQIISPQAVETISKNLVAKDILLPGLERMFLSPYGTWLLDQGPVEETIVYKKLPAKILKGGSYPTNTLTVLALKILVALSHWILLALALYAAFRFKLFGAPVLAFLAYTAAAAIGFVAFQGGNFDFVSHLSVFIVPFFPLFAVLVAGLFTNYEPINNHPES